VVRLGLASLVLVLSAPAGASPFPSAWLPRHGDGYLIPDTWAERGLRYGTPELVGLVERAARAVAEDEPGATLFVADMSLKSGAWTQWHRSHRSGCDVDLIFFAVDDDDRPARAPDHMVSFDDDGVAWRDGRRLHFDTARNWALVRALLTDPEAQVVRVFISTALRARLLDYATWTREPPELVAHAAEVLAQPGDSEAHDDHMHVRIAPPPGVELVAARAPHHTVERAHRGKAHKLARHAKPKKRRPHK
jgi:penicillin-insensitive murein endopeptidase